MTTLANKPDFTSDDLIEGSSLHTITKAREDAYNRGIAEGLRRAADNVNTRCTAECDPLDHNGCDCDSIITLLRERADAVEQEAK